MEEPFSWHYPVLDYRVVDGDSTKATLDVGFHFTKRADCRVLGIDAPESKTDAGKLVTQVCEIWMSQAFDTGNLFWVSNDVDKYGRSLGDFYEYGSAQLPLGNFLLLHGLARPYDGGTRYSWLPSDLEHVRQLAVGLLV